MWGNPEHLLEMDRIIRETKSSEDMELQVLLAETNRDDATYDGVDWGGERVAREVMDTAEKVKSEGKTLSRFSVTGYSLGGLLARYLVGILHQQDFFKDVSPVNFNAIATPHIGLPRYSSLFSMLSSRLGPTLLSRTGEQFYSVDKWSSTGQPLLEVMADPDRIFYRALALFSHIRIYANAINDTTVPYVTAAIEFADPFADYANNGMDIELDETYGPRIKSYTIPSSPRPPKPTVFSRRWFRSFKSDRPILPPVFQFPFPLNIAIYMLMPVLIPVVLSLVVFRLSMAARSSRARIKSLERDQSNGHTLIQALAHLEKRVEDAVVDIMEDPSPINEDSSLGMESMALPEQPMLTPLQRRIIDSLNKLPNLKKERAFITRVKNSHAVIVCRDVKRFSIHKRGEGIVRHWADHFIL
jgi:hypothetical protein